MTRLIRNNARNLIIPFIFYSAWVFSAPPSITFQVDHFTLEGNSPLPSKDISKFLSQYEGKQYDLTGLQNVSKRLESKIRDTGYAFYRVTLPPQSLSGGNVNFKLVSFSLDDIEMSGNAYFGNDNVLASLPQLIHGQSPNTQLLTHQIKVANHHVDKEVTVVFKQSDTADQIAAKVDVIENKPFHYSLLANNTGSNETGNIRTTAAFQYSNLWNKDHNINLSYTTSPNHYNDVKQYGLSYALPIYASGGWLSAYYAQSDVNTGRVAISSNSGLDVSGSGEMFGIHYLHFLPKVGNYEHAFDIGFDNRYFDNTVTLFDDLSTSEDIAPDVRSTPITLLYKGNIPFKTFHLGHHIALSKNLGIGSQNENSDYNNSRLHARSDWAILRYGLLANMNIEGWLFRINLKGQYTTESLISGEQFGLGGTYSVRGYSEREVGHDIGNSLNIEAFTPPWRGVKLLAFYDYGHGRNHDVQPDEQRDHQLASIGIGAIFQWKSYLFASVDLGHTLKNAGETQKNHNHAHANIVLQF